MKEIPGRRSTIQAALEAGMARHRAGKLQEAEQLYRQVLAAQPANADALNLLGVIALQVARYDAAIELVSRASQINPRVADYHVNLAQAFVASGRADDAAKECRVALELDRFSTTALHILAVTLRAQGQLAESIQTYRQLLALQPGLAAAHNDLAIALIESGQGTEGISELRSAIAIDPSYPDAWNNLGNALRATGKLDESIDAYQRALLLRADFIAAYNNLGIALMKRGKPHEAAEVFQKAVALDQNDAESRFNLGNALVELGRAPEAIASYRSAIEIQPDHLKAYNNLGLALVDAGLHDQAITIYQTAQSRFPASAELQNNLGTALEKKGRIKEAITHYTKAISLRSDSPEAYYNLGSALDEAGSLETAVDAYRRAIELRPSYADAYNNLSRIMILQGRADDAIINCRRAVEAMPNSVIAHYRLALMLLLNGEYEEGFREYEWRRRDPKVIKIFCQDFPQPIWDGRPLNGQRILLHTEQGFGDAIQFARYVPLVAQMGGSVILECQPELARLFGSIAGVRQLVVRGDPLPAFEVHCPLLSLPFILKTTLSTIPSNVPYLSADRQQVEHWRTRIDELAKGRRKAGLVWGSRPLPDPERSIPLDKLAPLGSVRDAWFCSLQKGEAAADARTPPDGLGLSDFSADLHDFGDTAAVVESLDFIISVDTSVAHLAGALGKPVSLLLPRLSDWRWLLDRHDSPWYPSMRLFRQPKTGDWMAPVSQLLRTLNDR